MLLALCFVTLTRFRSFKTADGVCLSAEAASDFAEAFELGEERFGWAKDTLAQDIGCVTQ